MLKQPNTKYRPFPPVALADRQWPNRTITAAPIWMSTDLRDGNQALFEPMDAARKMRMFKTLCAIGFKEIEVAFPAASQTDFDFVRTLIEDDHIPDDVTIEVLTQARDPLIDRTLESLIGARRAIVHVYNATSRPFRETVFGLNKDEVIALAVAAVERIKAFTARHPETEWILEYSPETFTATELEFAKAICDAVTETWDATPQRKVILNLPATVEVTTPNVYADQIEWMHRHLARRDSVILSVHPHNDRGTAVAAAELAVMAGADRVEGCLFGNGERTGNVDLVTLALNLYTQGVDPQLDFSDINAIARTVEDCTQLPIHPRHPYVGDLVFTAFSGSHQDAIKKGFAARDANPDGYWQVPYLPIDPNDVGRSYDSIIRINSQSGKGGISYIMENEFGIHMPRRMQVEFSGIVQRHTDATGGEVSSAKLQELFSLAYIEPCSPFRYVEHHLFEQGHAQGIKLTLEKGGQVIELEGIGNGPIDAAVNALNRFGAALEIRDYREHSLSQSADSKAIAFVEMRVGSSRDCFGAGIDQNIVAASLKSVVAGLNRIICLAEPQSD